MKKIVKQNISLIIFFGEKNIKEDYCPGRKDTYPSVNDKYQFVTLLLCFNIFFADDFFYQFLFSGQVFFQVE